MRGIYVGTNIFTNTVYYGQSVNIDTRIKRHIRDLKNNKHDNDHLQKAWNKYGECAFVFKPVEIIEDLSILLTPIEKKYWSSTDNKYNIADPENPTLLSEEGRKKISASNKRRTGSIEYKHSEETKKKMSEAHVGNKNALGCKHPHSEEAKKKISAYHEGIRLARTNTNR